jgi:hypothetical protein
MEERERRLRRVERLLREVQHRAAVLADRVEHHRPLGDRDDLAHDVDRLGLEPLQVREVDAWECVHDADGPIGSEEAVGRAP